MVHLNVFLSSEKFRNTSFKVMPLFMINPIFHDNMFVRQDDLCFLMVSLALKDHCWEILFVIFQIVLLESLS